MHLTTLVRSVLYRASFRAARNTIATSPKNMQEVLDDLKNNPYYDKYSSKIKQLQKEKPEQFQKRVEDVEQIKKKKIEAPKERQYAQLLNPKEKISTPEPIKREGLEKIMKIDLIKDKNTDEIKSIWEQYHLQKEYCIAATIPSSDFEKMQKNSAQYPTFILPLPRSQGYEFMMCQFAQNTVHFTPLLYFQVHKENAPECLTIIHYDEFKDDKNIVLMRGEYDKNVLDAKEAQCLANQLQMYYVQADPEKIQLLETFTKKPDEFKHMDLIKQIENLPLN
ncbi:unnamed protein product [Acanthoscelides obtectus]|uniref:ATP synthase mitochondrial F1 complex assembly factor 1 n=1 Tax=Acanthoscelides obtectus TaxID=200917 RepID=A0A9P0K3V0_ACAOB|nr:unnamed protein product [Acanthoscelides obtectus]CAK1638084.1 ATP synthase mitochondrial F1 complex assembly factor 1 [Acanthoscelides obtectus]